MTDRYVPAAGRRAFTRLYDPVVALSMREATFRGRLCAQVLAGSASGASVVDVGCGTGTLAIALAARGAEVVAVDGDPEVLSLAAHRLGQPRAAVGPQAGLIVTASSSASPPATTSPSASWPS